MLDRPEKLIISLSVVIELPDTEIEETLNSEFWATIVAMINIIEINLYMN